MSRHYAIIQRNCYRYSNNDPGAATTFMLHQGANQQECHAAAITLRLSCYLPRHWAAPERRLLPRAATALCQHQVGYNALPSPDD
jgi:hypothetical protein